MSRSMGISIRRGRELVIPTVMLVVMALAAAVHPVRAASTTVNLDQWASTAKAWQNGNLNGNNSRYPEGGIVPFRVAFEGLSKGKHVVHINYDFTAGGHKAYDFLATWNVTNAAGRICATSGGAISSMCPSMPASSSAAFPSDPYKANGLPVSGAEAYSAAPRRLTIWGGTISSIKGPVHAGSPDGNSTGDFLVTFTSSGSAVLLAWGGHLAQSAYWDKARGGAPDGAAQVSGAPWHMRTLQLDSSGNKNQDRSIQPSAIVGELPPFALAPPTPPPGGGGGGGSGGGGGGGSGSNPGSPDDPRGATVTVPPTSTDGRPDRPPGSGSPVGLLAALVTVLTAGLVATAAARRPRRSS